MAPLLNVAAEWLSAGQASGLATEVRAMSDAYRRGDGSLRALTDLRAYVAARLPATYAACAAVLGELARLQPEFAPRSVLDLGAGPGTASWAAAEVWPSLSTYTMVDNHAGLQALASELCKRAANPHLASAAHVQGDMRSTAKLQEADLVLLSYALAECPVPDAKAIAVSAWSASKGTLVIIEPGTPAGFARILAARQAVLQQGAGLVAPCPHHGACPLVGDDWCHFSVRLPRSRMHMHAKSAVVPFEDEKFAYLIATRGTVSPAVARVLSPPQTSKVAVTMRLCEAEGIKSRQVARRTPAAYKQAKKLSWGDGLAGGDMEQLWPES